MKQLLRTKTQISKSTPSRSLVRLSQPASQPVHGPGTSHSPRQTYSGDGYGVVKTKTTGKRSCPRACELLPEMANRTRRITSRKSSAKCSNSPSVAREWDHPCPYSGLLPCEKVMMSDAGCIRSPTAMIIGPNLIQRWLRKPHTSSV